MRKPSLRRGETVWDWVVGILLMFLLLGLCIPFLNNLRSAGVTAGGWLSLVRPQRGSCRTQTINNLKQMALALHSFNDVHRRLPPAFDQLGDLKSPASIHVHLLPYVEQGPLYTALLAGQKDTDIATVPPFINPWDWSAPDFKGVQNFAANLRVFAESGVLNRYDQPLSAPAAIEPGKSAIPRTFTDGTSNTIAFSTRHANCAEGGSRYIAPPNSPFAAFFGQTAATTKAAISSQQGTYRIVLNASDCVPTPLMAHGTTNGVMVGLGDGSVRTVSASVSAETWNRAMQPNDGRILGSDWDD